MKSNVSNDTYWSGAWRCGPFILVPIVILNIMVWVFAIAQLVFGSTHGDSFNTLIDSKDGGEYALRMFALWVEVIHLPIHIMLFLQVFPGWHLHPAAALSFALVMMGVWFNFAFWGFMIDYLVVEWYVPKEWVGLSCARFALSLIVTALYIVYVVYAAAAVHQWRKRTGRSRSAKASAKKNAKSEEMPTDVADIEAGKR